MNTNIKALCPDMDNPRVISYSNRYIIDTGAICFMAEGKSPRDVLEQFLVFSAYVKPAIYATHQPNISIESKDLIVCNIGDSEVRVYPVPVTLNMDYDKQVQAMYLSAPFTHTDKLQYSK